MSWPPKGVCVVSKAASVKTWKHISSLGERAACGRRSLSFFFLSRIYFHTKSQTFWADQKEIRWSCCPPHFNPMASGHLLAGGLRNFFFFFFSPAGISARYGREPARCTRELCPTGRKHKKKNTGIRISLRVVVVAGRLVVDQSAGALVVIVGRGGGFEVGQVSGRYANVLCPPFFCDFFCPALFMIVSRSARISVTCTYPPTARTIFIFRFRNFKVFFWRPVKCRVRMFWKCLCLLFKWQAVASLR